MAMTSDKWKGAWGGKEAPSAIPGYRPGVQEESTMYVDESGQTWRVEAYSPASSPTFTLPGGLPVTLEDYHWRATLTSPANIYGEDIRFASVSGSESQYACVLGIDEFARKWGTAHVVPAVRAEGGGGIIWLLVLAHLAFSDKKGR